MSVQPAANTVTLDQFVSGLRAIPEERFRPGDVYQYLKNNPVDPNTLTPYLFFSKNHYTRNLIFQNELFALIAVGWETGQNSQIHNHYEQNCWMTIPIGRLRVNNFRVIEQNESTGYCRLEPADSLEIHQLLPAEVDPSEPVHQVLNLAEYEQRAVSLHIYSRPFEHCLVYSLEANQYREIPLHYTSEYGKLCDGEIL
jgi:predicted metal-dependent enzyme (double-stranded beta helix superfamily)